MTFMRALWNHANADPPPPTVLTQLEIDIMPELVTEPDTESDTESDSESDGMPELRFSAARVALLMAPLPPLNDVSESEPSDSELSSDEYKSDEKEDADDGWQAVVPRNVRIALANTVIASFNINEEEEEDTE